MVRGRFARRTTPLIAFIVMFGALAPLEPGQDNIIIRVPGYDPQHDANGLKTDFTQVGPRYFETLGIPFEAGGPWDPRAGAPTVVVNHTMAKRYWDGGNAVGSVKGLAWWTSPMTAPVPKG